MLSAEDRARASRAATLLASFKRNFDLGDPSTYYAVLALDGDEMGKWVSGAKAPPLRSVLTPDAVAYYENIAGGIEWLKQPRRLSPSYHLQFSEALANFALYAARRIVEDAHHGQLIYAGGDDVLAMLPADEALACARDLRLAFQGDAGLALAHPKFFAATKPGFIRLATPHDLEPTWPLLVPGERATVSVGVAIAHIKEPLQDVVHEAQEAEKRAKQRPLRREFDRETNTTAEKSSDGFGRDAMALSLFKRSGETIRWGAKFGSAAWRVLDHLRRHYRSDPTAPDVEPPIGKRFPYRLAQLLSAYGHDTIVDSTLAQIVTKELGHVISQQCAKPADWPNDDENPMPHESFVADCLAYLEELRTFSFEENRSGKSTRVEAPRRHADFSALFLTEAFIARHED